MVRSAPSNQEINEKSKGHQVARKVMNGLKAPNDQESADCRIGWVVPVARMALSVLNCVEWPRNRAARRDPSDWQGTEFPVGLLDGSSFCLAGLSARLKMMSVFSS